MKIISFFSGAGGLDKGFEKAGMEVVWANEFDKKIHETYRYNFPHTELDTRSIEQIEAKDLPKCDGIIGGPPCQSWSIAGALRGINDERGQLFIKYLNLIEAKKPKFFLAENVPDYKKLSIQTRLNGKVMQDAKLSQLIFSIPELISYVSKAVPWRAGDVLVTGTPGGVGFKRTPPVYMKVGDHVEVEISEIGVLSNKVEDEIS